MEISEYFLVIVVLLLVISVGSAEIITDGGGLMNSSNYTSTAVVGVVSGSVSSDDYINQLGIFYGLNVAPDDPVVTISSLSGNNISSDNLLCGATLNDNDGGSFTVETRWYLDGSLNTSISYSLIANGFFNATLDSGNTTKYDDWSCDMRIYDGEIYSALGSSSNITILNAAPVVILDSPVNDNSTIDRTPAFNWTGSDIDDDDLTYEINIAPYYGEDFVSGDTRNVKDLSDLNYTPLTDLQFLSDNNYYYKWKVRASDGEINGEWSAERNISIKSEVSMSFITNDIYFGNLAIEESSNTDDSLSPFVITNDGTVYINVSVNASALWIEKAPSNYQFKVDNDSTESNSFNWLSSLTNWTNMPLTGFVVAVDNLSYVDSSDTAEIDINITVPAGEALGIKNSTIVFSYSLAE